MQLEPSKLPIRVALIGTGVTIRTHLPAFRANPLFEIVGISGSSAIRAKEVAVQYRIPVAYPTYQALCEDLTVNLIVLASPNEHHEEHYKCALHHGKHLIVEKPLVPNSTVANQLASEGAKVNQIVIVNHQLRFLPAFQRMKDLISGGSLGRIFRVRIYQQGGAFVDPKAPWFWSYDSTAGGGIRWAMGSHLIDLWRFLQPTEQVYRIVATLDSVLTKRHGRECTGSSCMISNILTESGCNVDITTSAFGFGAPDFEVSVCGEQGELRFDMLNGLRYSDIESRGRWCNDTKSGEVAQEIVQSGSLFRAASKYLVAELGEAFSSSNAARFLEHASKLDDVTGNHQLLDWILESARSGKELIRGQFCGCNSSS